MGLNVFWMVDRKRILGKLSSQPTALALPKEKLKINLCLRLISELWLGIYLYDIIIFTECTQRINLFYKMLVVCSKVFSTVSFCAALIVYIWNKVASITASATSNKLSNILFTSMKCRSLVMKWFPCCCTIPFVSNTQWPKVLCCLWTLISK